MSIADRGFARIDAALKGHLRILPGGRLTAMDAVEQNTVD